MDAILTPVRYQLSLVNLHYIAVFLKLPVDHLKQNRRVWRRLYLGGVTLKLKKYKSFAGINDYLGHVIRLNFLELAKDTTDAVEKLEHPTTQSELRSYLGLWSVLRQFIPNFARLAAPLNIILKRD